MARSGLFWRIFLGTLTVGLGSVLAVGLVSRNVFTTAFSAYLGAPAGTHGRGMMGPGRTAVIGAAEQAFLSGVDRGVLLGGAVAILFAALAAFLLARALSAPLRTLEEGAAVLAAGDLSHRVDVTGPGEVVALGESFNSMAQALDDAEELRRRMVADVAHELRNPLTAARVQAEGIAEGVIPADRPRLESLVDDLAHLSRLVDDLQELALAEAGRLSYSMAPVDLGALARSEAERAGSHAGADVEIDARTPAGPVPVTGDEGRLAQVLRNLLSNAVRHTSAGGVVVAVTVDMERRSAEVRVTDTGSGIAADDLPHLFERFYRADSARARDTGGAGLGLSFARRSGADHGGETCAESVGEGHGASVGFRLPLGCSLPGRLFRGACGAAGRRFRDLRQAERAHLHRRRYFLLLGTSHTVHALDHEEQRECDHYEYDQRVDEEADVDRDGPGILSSCEGRVRARRRAFLEHEEHL